MRGFFLSSVAFLPRQGNPCRLGRLVLETRKVDKPLRGEGGRGECESWCPNFELGKDTLGISFASFEFGVLLLTHLSAICANSCISLGPNHPSSQPRAQQSLLAAIRLSLYVHVHVNFNLALLTPLYNIEDAQRIGCPGTKPPLKSCSTPRRR